MIGTSVAQKPEMVQGEQREPRRCAGCGEPAGSVSAGTGKPLVRDRATGGFFHVVCRPGFGAGAAMMANLERMGG